VNIGRWRCVVDYVATPDSDPSDPPDLPRRACPSTAYRVGRLVAVVVLVDLVLGTIGLALVGTGPAAPERPTAEFGWVHQSVPPPTWRTLPLPATAKSLAYPSDMGTVRSDTGTVSVARTASGRLLAYLNATPVEGGEAAAGFADFRLAHLRDEGATDVRLEAADERLAVGERDASCVVDTYTNGSAVHRYREIACLGSDHGEAEGVVIGAAPVAAWSTESPDVERAVVAFLRS
jgi:hypothetical protein